MQKCREELSRITQVLKDHPGGLSVTEIAVSLNKDRHSVAKYLEMLTVSGHVEMRAFGPSKIYHLSQRVPMSAMLDFSSDMVVVIDRKLKVIQANDRLLMTIGLKRDDVAGKHLYEVLPMASEYPRFQSLIHDALGGMGAGAEIAYRQDRTTLYFDVRLIPAAFEDGSKGAAIIIVDVTGRKRAEILLKKANRDLEKRVRERTAELARTGDTLRTVLDTAPVALMVVDAKTQRITYVSPHVALFFDFDIHGKVMDAHLYSITLLRPDGTEINDDELPLIKTLCNGEHVYGAEYLMKINDQETPVLVNSAPIHGQDGKIEAAVFSITDITGHKANERKLSEIAGLVRATLHASPVPMVAIDLNCNVIQWNAMAEKIFGWLADEVIGRPLPVVSLEGKEKIKRLMAKIKSDGHLPDFKIPHIRKDGIPVDLKVTMTPIICENSRMTGSLMTFSRIES